MPAQILAVGTGAANSSDVVVTDPITVAIKDAAGPRAGSGLIEIYLKDDAGQYFRVGTLFADKPLLIAGPGTYRFTRPASSESCGVFSG